MLPPHLDSTSSSNYYHALHTEEEEENEYDDDVTVVTSNTSCNKGYCSTGTYTTEEDTDDDWTTDDDSTSEEEYTKSDNKIQRNSEKNNNVTRQQAWNSIIQVNNLQDLPAANIIFDNQRVVKQVEIEYALSDSGASGHFLVEGAPVTRKRVAKNPISIVLPDGSTVQSTHTCHLDIPWLPDKMTEAHIVPQLAHSSLISTRKFCEAGCKVVFDINECRVYYNNELVLVGGRDRRSRLWKLPINPQQKPSVPRVVSELDINIPTDVQQHTAFTVYTLPYKQQQLKYMHQTFFNLPIPTLLKAIENKQLEGIPFMKAELIKKYLARSPATSKGGMKHPRTGIRSTRETRAQRRARLRRELPETVPIQHPQDKNDSSNNVFCFAALADKQSGTLYTDATGTLPVMSLDGYQYYFIAYDYDTNYIYAIPIKDVQDKTIIAAFDEVFQDLTDKGYKPTLNVTDNQATRPLKKYLKTKNCKWQFVEPHNHRVNAAERAIQTFKNHFIRGLCTTDQDWPMQLWDQLTTQALITLNLVRTSRIDSSKSAYHQIHGHKFDWNRYPMAPPGTKAVIWLEPNERTSWGTRGLDAWYCGPSLDHYRNCNFYVPKTKSYRISASFDLFPQHCMLPEFTPDQHANEVHNELVESVEAMTTPGRRKLIKRLNDTVKNLNSRRTSLRIRQPQRVIDLSTTEGEESTTEGGETTTEGDDEEEVVFNRPTNVPCVTTSTNPTDPDTLRSKPRTHQRHTRRNTPGTLPDIVNPTNLSLDENNNDESPIISITELHSPSSERIPRYYNNTPHIITQEAVNLITEQVYYNENSNNDIWIPERLKPNVDNNNNMFDLDIEHFCGGVVHPITGETITKYQKIVKDPLLKPIWERSMGKEFGSLAQGDTLTGEKGTDCMFVMDHNEIANIPTERTITYGRIVIDYRPQKEDPNRVRITAGGNLITDYPGEVTTRTADLTTSKILWNSVLSTEGAKFMTIDIKNFFPTAPLDRYEYMKMPIKVFPQHTIDQYDMINKAKNGFVYLEIRRAIYGLPMAGALANKLLKERLAPAGYYEVPHTPGLWRHTTRPIEFSLVVDDFGVKYVGKEHAEHLVQTLQQDYTISVDWSGDLYCGIKLDWNYEERYLDISMPGYVTKLLQRFEHETKRKQYSPYPAQPRKFGTAAQEPLAEDTTMTVDEERKKRVQQIVGGLLYYARAVDNTILTALNAIATQQANATEATEEKIKQLLDYMATNRNATVRYRSSDMVLNIHSDASYLSETKARSRIAGYFFLGSLPQNDKPIPMNGAIHVQCGILKSVVTSAAEAELGALFETCKEGKVIRLILEELGHPQPPTPVHCDNATATGIANNNVKKQRSRHWDMRFFWVTDQVQQQFFDVQWHPGQENLADYFTKHFEGRHHIEVRPWYLHTDMSPLFLPRAAKPSTLRGCVGRLSDGYRKAVPLPRVSSHRQSHSPVTVIDLASSSLFCHMNYVQ